MVFGWLPSLNNCCYCVELKLGVLLVCIATVIFLLMVNYPVPSGCYVQRFLTPLKVIIKLKYATSALLFVAAFILFIGVFADWKTSFTFYCIVALIYFVLDMTTTILFLVSGFKRGIECGGANLVLLGFFCCFPLLLLYFVLVVNSYHEAYVWA